MALKATCLCSANHVFNVCVLLVTGVGLGERLKNYFITTLFSVDNYSIPACIDEAFCVLSVKALFSVYLYKQ